MFGAKERVHQKAFEAQLTRPTLRILENKSRQHWQPHSDKAESSLPVVRR